MRRPGRGTDGLSAQVRLGKVGQYALVLLVAVTLNFLLPRAMPGSPLVFLAGEDVASLTPAQRDELRRSLGLDRPLWVQYVRYLGQLVSGDLGYSFQKGRPVRELVAERLPWTLALVGSALVAATVLGTVWGTVAAWRRGSRLDVASVGLALLLESAPSFWLGMLLIAAFAVRLRWFPVFGAQTAGSALVGWAWLADVAWHLVLPLATLTLLTVPSLFLVMRASLLSVLGAPYITTARAKGVPELGVVSRHAVRNALLPVFTVFMLNLGTVVGGATVVETVFSYPGLGRLLYEAVLNRDYPVMQSTFLILTVSVVAANLAADLVYPWIDPRVR